MATPEETVHNRFLAEFFVAVDRHKGQRTAESLKELARSTLEGMQFRFLDGNAAQLEAQKQIYTKAVEKGFSHTSDADAYKLLNNIQKLPKAEAQGWALTDGALPVRPEGTIMNEADQIVAMENELRTIGIDLKKNAQLEVALSSSVAQRAVGGGSVPKIPSAPPASGIQR